MLFRVHWKDTIKRETISLGAGKTSSSLGPDGLQVVVEGDDDFAALTFL